MSETKTEKIGQSLEIANKIDEGEIITYKGQELMIAPKQNKTFKKLNAININDKIKTKMGLKYLSWAYAWGELLSAYPDATFTVYTRTVETNETTTQTDGEGLTKTTTVKYTQEIPYFTDGISGFVKVGVTVQGIEYIEYYPIMDLKNNSVRARNISSVDVNKALQRAFVKACARHGLGLYIYSGEDLPEEEKNAPVKVSVASDFATVQSDVINLVKKLQTTEQNAEVVRYIKEVFPDTKLSATTEAHLDKLIAARTYLTSLQDKLGK